MQARSRSLIIERGQLSITQRDLLSHTRLRPEGLFSFVLHPCQKKEIPHDTDAITEDTHPPPSLAFGGDATAVLPRNRCSFAWLWKLSRACPRSPHWPGLSPGATGVRPCPCHLAAIAFFAT